jgi:hypothetical protein
MTDEVTVRIDAVDTPRTGARIDVVSVIGAILSIAGAAIYFPATQWGLLLAGLGILLSMAGAFRNTYPANRIIAAIGVVIGLATVITGFIYASF